MSLEQLKAFLEKVKADSSLQEKLKVATDPEAVVVIAKEVGFSISADDLTNPKLSDEELEGLAGGNCILHPSITDTPSLILPIIICPT